MRFVLRFGGVSIIAQIDSTLRFPPVMLSAMVEYLVVVFSGIAALATAATALYVRRQLVGDVIAEWSFAYSQPSGGPAHNPTQRDDLPQQIEVRLTIRNNRQSTVWPRRVDVFGIPVIDVGAGNPPQEKHESWQKNSSPLGYSDVGPGSHSGWRIVIQPDWAALGQGRWYQALRRSSPKLRIRATITSKSNRRWRTRKTATMIVRADTIKLNAAKVAPVNAGSRNS